MAARKLFVLGSAIVGALTYRRFRAEQEHARQELKSGSNIIETSSGPIEYAEEGSGPPLLVIHGAGGGYDQGLLVGRDLGEHFRIIAPSRFGYLRTPVPEDFSTVAQAEAHVALLDHLKVDRCPVMGVSAGAPSALMLALRHPERVSALVLLSPRLFHPELEVSADDSLPSRTVLSLLERASDFLFWVAIRVSRPSVLRFLGVPANVIAGASALERQRVTALMRSIMPLRPRLPGLKVDSQVLPEDWPLEQVFVPTLIIAAEDDLYRTLPGARLAASRIPEATIIAPATGGHLLVGHKDDLASWIGDFLAGSRRMKAGRQAQAAEAELV